MLIEPAAFPQSRRVAVVAARFNEAITEPLLAGCVRRLRERGLAEGAIDVARVPGAFEVPALARRLALTGRYAAVVCLGALVRGDTPHFEYIAQACSTGIMQVALETGVPLAFGIITCNTVEQALERVADADPARKPAPGAKAPPGHKGVEAADAAVDMACLFAATGPVRVEARV